VPTTTAIPPECGAIFLGGHWIILEIVTTRFFVLRVNAIDLSVLLSLIHCHVVNEGSDYSSQADRVREF
jgi:hypothetical protein